MLLTLLATALIAAPADYRNPSNWICRPGHNAVCAIDPVRAVVRGDGAITYEQLRAAAAPEADCFYVYPTASKDPTANSDLIPGVEEKGQAASQLAAFASLCRTFAPMYRQVTLTALRSALASSSASGAENPLANLRGDRNLAYADVKASWEDYLQHDNHGRPFVLIGHSQGSMMLKRLIAEEIDGKPVAARMLSAILPGTAVMVPEDRDVGGDFQSIPLCRSDTETACVITWASYRDVATLPSNALFGRSTPPSLRAGCVNPARLSGGAAPLDAILGYPWWIQGVVQYREPPGAWTVDGKPVGARYARIPGLLTGECVVRDGLSYLAVHVEPGVGGGLGTFTTAPGTVGDEAYPEWGWHVMDIPIVQGDLVRVVGRQLAAWTAAKKAPAVPAH
jgi:hypothetical protein